VIPLALSAALLVGVGAVGFEATTSVSAEVATGVAPRRPFAPSRPALLLSLDPALTARAYTRRASLELAYDPQLFLRFPDYYESSTPRLLHRGSMTHAWRFTRRTTWDNYASMDYGEIDYSEYARVFDVLDSATLSTSRLGLIGFGARTGLTQVVTRRYQLTLGAAWTRRDVVGDVSSVVFPTSVSTTLDLTQRVTLSRTDTMSVGTRVGQTRIEPGLDYDLATAQATWGHRLASRASTSLGAGVAAFEDERGNRLASPTATVAAEAYLGATRELRWSANTSGSAGTTLDPLTGVPRDSAGLTVGVAAAHLPWTLSLGAAAGTSAGRGSSDFERSQTYLSAQLAASRARRREPTVSFGVRTFLQQSLTPASPQALTDYQALAFVSVSYERALAGHESAR
jgi:hypothetical protein